jgi:RNA polymerase-interacting CarD/CdnL/TRCF family regulator
MLENAKHILYSELALVENIDEEQVELLVEGCLN